MNSVYATRSAELLAPAGSVECAWAAVENGADAIYFGLDVGFNARARAHNIGLDELPSLMNRLHRRGVRGYVTLNTLVFTDEMERLEAHVRAVADAGVDAVLVQDLGGARLIREICPGLEIHASTQMTLTCADAIELARPLGIDRVVLPRELSLSEIKRITRETSVPVEVFVHGALCVAYSGQCLTSESLGGRSANRGQCAQACRLPYELSVDGHPRNLGDVKYLLSPQDLAAYELIPQLLEAGVASLKIEGRLKTPEYVANITAHYRKALDQAQRGEPTPLADADRRDMEMSFSRGFSPGWLEGCDHKRLVPGLSSAKRGVRVGTVKRLHGDRLHVELTQPLVAGDGIVLEGNRAAGEEFGGRIFEIFRGGRRLSEPADGLVELTFATGAIHGKRIQSGMGVWQTDDPRLNRRLRQTYSGPDPTRRMNLAIHVEVAIDQPIQVTVRCSDGVTVKVTDEHRVEAARRLPITVSELERQFGRLGGSPYRLASLTAAISGAPMVPASILGRLRHALLAALTDARETRPPRATSPPGVATRLLAAIPAAARERERSTADSISTLHILCRSLNQIQGALEAGARHLIADFQDLREYREAVAAARDNAAEILLATLRIHKPGEDGLFRALAKHNADGWLVRHLAGVRHAREAGIPWVADFSLNATNPLTVEQCVTWGATRVTPSYDLNRDQLLELAAAVPPERLEIVIHQHMPLFHMEHCVFCAVLSPGKNKSDCGRPCDRHQVVLTDHVGVAHPLVADIGCRNTLFNGIPQSGAEAVAPLQRLGIANYRIELLNEKRSREIARLFGLYRDLLSGRVPGSEVWRELRAHNRVGVTRGTLEQPRDPLAIL